MNMGERIKQLRLDKGMTQEQLGQKIGVQKSAIRKYEKGEIKNIKRSSIKILSQLFEVDPSYLMGWDEEFNKNNKLSIEIKLFEQIQDVYGKDTIALLNQFMQLNVLGRLKAIEILADLTEIIKYTE